MVSFATGTSLNDYLVGPKEGTKAIPTSPSQPSFWPHLTKKRCCFQRRAKSNRYLLGGGGGCFGVFLLMFSLVFVQCPGPCWVSHLILAGFSSLICMCNVLWTARVLDWQKPFPHSWHLKGFSLEWMYLQRGTQHSSKSVFTKKLCQISDHYLKGNNCLVLSSFHYYPARKSTQA